jgi:hypothetical protein
MAGIVERGYAGHMEPERRPPTSEPPRETPDARVERLARELGDAIADEQTTERRAELRDYAAELVREDTLVEPGATGTPSATQPMGPLAVATLLVLVGAVLLVVATPIGIVTLLLAAVAGAWGVVAARREQTPP